VVSRTERLYRDDPYLLEFDGRVVERRAHDGRPAVVLDRTAFYAESGGQPYDIGTLSGVPVRAVLEQGDDVLHVLDAELPADAVHGVVDAVRRRDHRQQHHGQHLLSRAFVDVAGARTVSFHLGSSESTIDLDTEVGDDALVAAEACANDIVWDARPVTVRTVTRAEALALGVAPPDEAGDRIRLVEAAGFDVQPCGGTHPRSTSEVGVVLVVGRERYKAGSRVRFVCGHRALRFSRGHVALLDGLATLLSAPHPRLPEAAERLQAQLLAAEKRAADLLDRALEGEARRLLSDPAAQSINVSSGPARLVVATYDGWPPADLRVLANQLVRLDRCICLLASRSDKAHLVFAQAAGLSFPVPKLLAEAAAQVGGRGGGKGDIAQGGGDRLEGLADALAHAAEAVQAAASR
jgi:alanyl-tRNA synthetase